MIEKINDFVNLLPVHEASLTITHNDHKNDCWSVEEWAEDNSKTDYLIWVNDDEKQKAIELDSIWEIQVFPRTPIGSYSYCASSLSALIEHVQWVGI